MDDDLLLGVGFTVLLIFCALIAAILADLLSNREAGASAQRKKVEQRAYILLKEWLSPEQLAQLERHGYFEVRGSHSGKCYRIRRDRNMNIDELDGKGFRVAVWCFGPTGQLPLGDNMLAQKIALETDEQAALAIANRAWERRRGRYLQSNLPNAGVSSDLTPAIVNTGRVSAVPCPSYAQYEQRHEPDCGATIWMRTAAEIRV
jgi:hypothetical protein